MTTLRRERKKKFTEILMKFYVGVNDGVLDELLAAAESRTKHKTDEIKGDYVAQANKKMDAILAFAAQASEHNSWQGRELFRPDHIPFVDWYHERTGQTCPKSKQNDWMRALLDWSANALTVEDLQAAYEMDIKWRGVFTSPNELTTKAIAIKAQRKTPARFWPSPQISRNLND